MDRYRPGRTSALSTQAVCIYPGCSAAIVSSPSTKGRRAMFCSPDCRANFFNIRKQLLKHLAALDREAQQLQNSPPETARLRRQRDLAEWHLIRFRAADGAEIFTD